MTEAKLHAVPGDFPLRQDPRVSEESPGGHVVQFYDDDALLAGAAGRFLAHGLRAGEALVVIATPEHTASIEESLAATGIDVSASRAAGELVTIDAAGALSRFMVGDEPDWDRFDSVVGGAVARSIATSASGRVRAYGEMVDVLWRKGQRRGAVRLEEFWDRLRAQYPISLLCAYVMGNFFSESHSDDFRHVCDLHERVIPANDCGGDRDARTREISLLQQRALALETELFHRKELEEALRCAREQAETASRAKDEFLAMLGHELRNPLSPILTALELMKLRDNGRVTREQAIVERQTRHLIRLVDDLLDVSRVARGVLELRRARVDLRDVLAKATDIASPLLEMRRHHFDVQAPPRGALFLHADEARLAQVIANLLTNSAKYTPPGGHVSVRARRDDAEVVLEVRDDGNGIAPELLPHVFDLFVQGRQPLDRNDGGLGIGLALVRSLVQLHGGTVTAQSEGAGKGCVFTVRLPPGEVGDPTTFAAELRTQPIAVESRRILLVDDNEDALAMLAEILRGAGHEVCTAADGPSALDVVREFRPDVAVLDIGLPAMDGYELGARLRSQLGSSAPVLIALSGYGQESDRARSQVAGFALHLVKPLDSAALLSAIEDRLRN
jgi:signal transduction histidine kinase/CheY-like chemotaxis protein